MNDLFEPCATDEVWQDAGEPHEALPDDVYREGFDDEADYEWTETHQ